MQNNRLFKTALEVLTPRENFRRRFLITKDLQLVMPPIPLQDHFKLPQNAAVHFVVMDGITKGPDGKDWRLAAVDKPMPIQTIMELTRLDGNPTRLTVNLQNEVDAWVRTQRRFRKTRDVLATDPGEQGAVVYNYAMLAKAYRYQRSLFTEMYRWTNIWSTVIDKINEATNTREHIIFLPLPKRLPSMRQMQKVLAMNTSGQLREMPDPDERMIFEIWKWINPETRGQSIFAPLTEERLKHTILIFEDAGRTLGFEMGVINSWIDAEGFTKPDQRVRLKPVELQKRILRGMIGLMQQRVDAAGVNDTLDGEEDDASVRVVTDIDDAPQQDNAEEGFASRAEAILKTLDADIEAHDLMQEETSVADEDPSVRGMTITERGESATVQSFDQISTFNIDDYLQSALDQASERGTMTVMEYRKFNQYMGVAESIESPYGGGMTAREFARVDPQSTEIAEVGQSPDDAVLIDKSMRERVFDALDGDYIRNTLNRDKVAMVQSIQKAGIIVTGHVVEQIDDVMDSFESHTVRLQPIEGASSPIRFKSVLIDEQGRIQSNGTDYRFRRQRVDLPIRKINANQVALASYYPNKTFVIRSDRSAYNYNLWLQKQIRLQIVNKDGPIKDVRTGNSFVHTIKAPTAYTALAQEWRSMTVGDVSVRLNIKNQDKDFGEEAVLFAANQGLTLFGKGLEERKGVLFALDDNNTVYTIKDGDVQVHGSFESFIGADESSRPLEFTECRIFGKGIPTGIVLGYYFGLSGLVKMLGARVRQVPAGTRANLGPGEYSLVFEDFTLVFSQDDRVASLVLGGFVQASKTLRRYSMFHFDQPAVYFNVLENMGMSGRYLRELDDLRTLFVDPITERVLVKMGEPTSYPQLVYRATQMLVNDYYKRPLDPTEQRYRGAERIPGAIYTQLVVAIREQHAKSTRSTARIEMKPYSVFKHTMSDPSLMMVKDINPVHNLKEITAVTYTGHGGRSSRSMTRVMRAMDVNDLGTLSEATVDSSQVGYNAHLSVAPRIANTEGFIKPPIGAASSVASLLSPSALAAAAINSDDGKRIGMASIQQSHTISCVGYTRNCVNTGFERVMAHHVDDSFASVAKQAGKIKSKNAYGIVVQYDDGTTQAIATGRRFGAASGMTIPHDMQTQYNSGDTFEQGSVLVYDAGFFMPAKFKKGVVDWMNGTIARVAFPDTRETHEDASSISMDFEQKIMTRVTRPRDILVTFDNEVHEMVKTGQHVKYSDNLCIKEDRHAAKTQVFSEERLNTLKSLSGNADTAQVSGVVDRVEVFYNGMVEDMTDSLREIVEASDKELARRRKAMGKSVVTGLVDDTKSFNGEPLMPDTAIIRVYITHTVGASSGDKGVLGWQLKSEISKVYYKRTTLDDNRPVDLFYGSKSLFARVVYSAFKIGTGITVSGLASVQMAKIFKGITK